jgi:carbon storage regulator CsrA
MLVLTRKTEQKIQIGENITITVIRVKGQSVRIGIEAPTEVRVMRSELTLGEERSMAGKPMTAMAAVARALAPRQDPASPQPVTSSTNNGSDAQEAPACRPLASRLCRTPGASPAPMIRRPERLGPACLRSMARRF